jgi:hypothetical protein
VGLKSTGVIQSRLKRGVFPVDRCPIHRTESVNTQGRFTPVRFVTERQQG